MKPVAFDYHRPETVSEAVALLSELGEEAAVLSGGMTLGPMLNLRMVRPRVVIDVSRIAALKTISLKDNLVVTGAGEVQADAMSSDLIAEELPLLAMALPGSDTSKPAIAARSAARSRMPIRVLKFRCRW
jgi:2-furoyl-CoA dehydrogenase FAD binding subunit